MGTVPKDFQDATLLAVTNTKRCVGIRIFHQPHAPDHGETFEGYIARCIRDAVDLKESIETGVHNIENDARMVPVPNADQYINIGKLLDLRSKQMLQSMRLKYENQLIDLGRALITSAEMDQLNYDVCQVCLTEMIAMTKFNMLTPLMLKKNPAIVHWIAKLCRFTDNKRQTSRRSRAIISEQSQQIRNASSTLLNAWKILLDFDGTNGAFMTFFYENVKLFHELTANMPYTEKRQLTIDPEESIN